MTNAVKQYRLIFMLALLGLGSACGDRPPPETLVEGRPVPVFLLSDLDGRPWRLEALRGKVVLLNFWAPWCQPCRLEMPSLQRLSVWMRDRTDFVVLTVLYGSDVESAKKFMQDNEVSLTVLVDEKLAVARLFGVTGVPETYIVDRQGILRDKAIGPVRFDRLGLKKHIEGLLSK